MDIPITLNVKSANVIPVINCMQGDTPTIICTILNGKDPFNIAPGEFDLCVCEGETAKHKAVSIKCVVSNNIVAAHLTKNETDEAGDLKLCISFSNTAQNLVVSTFPFILKATENPAYSAVGQKENVEALNDYIAKAKEYADIAKSSGTNISGYVDSAKKYAESASESKTGADNAKSMSMSYAIGDSGLREGETTDNSKYYSKKSAESMDSANTAAESARQKAKDASESAVAALLSEKNALQYEKASEKSANESFLSEQNADKSAELSKTYAQRAETVSANVLSYLKQIEIAGDSQLSRINDALGQAETTFEINLETGHLEYTGSKLSFNIEDNGHLEWEVV